MKNNPTILKRFPGLTLEDLLNPILHIQGAEGEGDPGGGGDPGPGGGGDPAPGGGEPGGGDPPPGGGKPGQGDPGSGDPKPPEPGVVPEAYQAFSVPTGDDGKPITTIPEDLHSEMSAVFKDMKLDQATAQKGVDLFLKTQQNLADQSVKEFKEQLQVWETAGRKDDEIGGDKHDEILSRNHSLVDHFSPPAKDPDGNPIKDGKGRPMSLLRMVLDATGVGSHPELNRFLNRIGRELGEDFVFTPGGGGGEGPEGELHDRLYSDESVK